MEQDRQARVQEPEEDLAEAKEEEGWEDQAWARAEAVYVLHAGPKPNTR